MLCTVPCSCCVLHRFGRFQWLLLGYTALAWAAEAMELLLLSFIGPAATAEWGLQGGQEASLSSVVFVGMLVGAYAWGLLADAKGRRWVCCRPSAALASKPWMY